MSFYYFTASYALLQERITRALLSYNRVKGSETVRIKLSVLAVFAALTFLSPMAVFLLEDKQPKADIPASGITLTLQDSTNGTTVTADLNDYLCGALAAEGGAEMEPEALKAMAIVLRTYACKSLQTNPDTPLAYNGSYWDHEAQKARWGSDYLTCHNKIVTAVNDTADTVITYGGELIVPAYHKISSGTTESAADMWGRQVPYLVGVEASFDMLSKQYMSRVVLTPKQVKEQLEDLKISFTDDENSWFGTPVTTAGGSVTTISLCGSDISGQELAKRLGLASPCFTVTAQEDGFVFQVLGIGDGVGLSQNGADYLAAQGKTANEIIAYFYTEVALEQRKDF